MTVAPYSSAPASCSMLLPRPDIRMAIRNGFPAPVPAPLPAVVAVTGHCPDGPACQRPRAPAPGRRTWRPNPDWSSSPRSQEVLRGYGPPPNWILGSPRSPRAGGSLHARRSSGPGQRGTGRRRPSGIKAGGGVVVSCPIRSGGTRKPPIKRRAVCPHSKSKEQSRIC